MTIMERQSRPAEIFAGISGFTLGLDYSDIPAEIRTTAQLLILDLIGVLAAASKLDAGRIARDHAYRHWAAGEDAPRAALLFDGRPTSLTGHGFAMATQIDNLDAHDGWQPSKGHAGAALFPALTAFAQGNIMSGQEAVTAMVVGYEIAYRAAAALHQTVPDYHTSGAWNALGCAAIGARSLSLTPEQLRHAFGIAEYHGPRSQMMREIANPTMLHDGTGFGAPVGIYAALIAKEGFTGAPAATVEFADAAFAWRDLGADWLTGQQYIKPYPICRWAHAPIDAALGLRKTHNLTGDMVERVDIFTFAYSAELNCDPPTTSSIAQYSIAWPVAAALVRGKVGVDEVTQENLDNPAIVDLTRRTHAHVDPAFEAEYPAQRRARIEITLNDGRVLDSGPVTASGGPVPQPAAEDIIAKFRVFAGSVMDPACVSRIENAVLHLHDPDADFSAFVETLARPL